MFPGFFHNCFFFVTVHIFGLPDTSNMTVIKQIKLAPFISTAHYCGLVVMFFDCCPTSHGIEFCRVGCICDTGENAQGLCIIFRSMLKNFTWPKFPKPFIRCRSQLYHGLKTLKATNDYYLCHLVKRGGRGVF